MKFAEKCYFYTFLSSGSVQIRGVTGKAGVISDDKVGDCSAFSSWSESDCVPNSNDNTLLRQFPRWRRCWVLCNEQQSSLSSSQVRHASDVAVSWQRGNMIIIIVLLIYLMFFCSKMYRTEGLKLKTVWSGWRVSSGSTNVLPIKLDL